MQFPCLFKVYVWMNRYIFPYATMPHPEAPKDIAVKYLKINDCGNVLSDDWMTLTFLTGESRSTLYTAGYPTKILKTKYPQPIKEFIDSHQWLLYI